MDTSGPIASSQAAPMAPAAPALPPTASAAAPSHPIAEEDDPGDAIDPYLASLRQRQPNLDNVIACVKKSNTYKKAMDHNKYITQGSPFHDALFDTALWTKVSGKLLEAIYECHATRASQANARTKKFLEKRRRILRSLPRHLDELQGAARSEYESTLYLIGVEFLREWVAQLVNDRSVPPLDKVVEGAMHPDANWEPGAQLSETVYYISGYLLKAAQMAGLRRGKKSAIGRALQRLSEAKYNVKNDEDLEKVQSELPTGKVDRMVALGGLKYPTAEFYAMVCRIENVYRTTLKDEILIVEGGGVVRRVNDELVENTHLSRMFNTFLPSDLDEQDQTETLRCFLKTFGHLRGKDIVRKKMSLWRKNPSVGLRQTIAALSNRKSTLGSNNNKKKKARSEEKSGEESKTEADGEMSREDRELIEDHNEMSNAVEDSVDSDAE